MRFRHVFLRILPWRCAAICAFVAACLLQSGCGNGLAQVSGQILVDGKPLHGANGDVRVTVKFLPAGGVGPTAVGLADETGNYTLGTGSQSGVAPGEYLVACSGSELVRAAGTNAVQGGRQITDPKYGDAKTSGLKFTVQPGKNQFDIQLTSPPNKAAGRGA